MRQNKHRMKRHLSSRFKKKQIQTIQTESKKGLAVKLQPEKASKTEEKFFDYDHEEEFTAFELCQGASDSIQFLLSPLIPSKSICFLTGSSDCNKSTFLRQLAIAIAFGKNEFLGFNLNAKHKKVLLVITEDDKENISVDIKKTLGLLGSEENAKNISFIFTTENIPKKIKEFIAKNPVDTVIIDTWTDTFSGDINTSNKVRENLKIYRKIIQTNPCAVICLHHTGKRAEEKAPSKNSMLGSQGIEATARIVLEIRRLPENEYLRGLTVLKGNYTPDCYKDKTFKLEFDPDTFTLKNLTDVSQFQILDENSSSKNRGKYLKRNEIVNRLVEIKDQNKLSFEKARIELTKEFGEVELPGITQLKTWYWEHKWSPEEPKELK